MSAVPYTQRGEGELRTLHRTPNVHDLAAYVRKVWAERRDHPRIAYLAIPLEMITVALLGDWLLWVPLVGLAVVAMPSWRWACLFTAQLGFVGTEWAGAGASYLAQFPDERVVVEVFWLAFPMALAGAGYRNMRHKSGV